jgi:pimeloyl-ACP methyl ester carboxylesterase
MAIRFEYVDTKLGQLHIATAGQGYPLILLHQTPRSWDEFRELIPFLATKHRVIAMDMYGFGQSVKFPKPHSIEKYASGVIALADAMNLPTFNILGHHTGALVAFLVAADNPERVKDLILSAPPFTDVEYREKHKNGEGVDDASIAEDGSHLTSNWAKRYPFYPKNRPDILNRFIRDSLSFGLDPQEGHLACSSFIIEDSLCKIVSRVLLLAPSEDPFSFPQSDKFLFGLKNTKGIFKEIIQGGKIPLMEEKSEEVSKVVLKFLGE